MNIAGAVITTVYYALTAGVAVILAYNFVKCRRWDQELLYIVVLLPFLLRLFLLK